jgi:osmoprotectant transport system permease protein
VGPAWNGLAAVIDFLVDVGRWFPENWSGGSGVVARTREHLELSAAALLTAAVIALPAAAWLGHTRRGGSAVVALVNIGRAMPTFGIVALALPVTMRLADAVPFISSGLGFAPIYIALVALALPPIFINAHVGVMSVDRDIVEAARAMGVTGRQVLTQVEVPMASPVILAGIRVTAVQVVATAPLGALVAFGGLGRFIIDGFATRDGVQIFSGAVLVAVIAGMTDAVFSLVERSVVPRGIGGRRRRRRARPVGGAWIPDRPESGVASP